MSARNQRALARMVHSLSGVTIALYVYGPAAVADVLRLPLQAVILPVVILTGTLLWQQARLHRWLTRRTPQGDLATQAT